MKTARTQPSSSEAIGHRTVHPEGSRLLPGHERGCATVASDWSPRRKRRRRRRRRQRRSGGRSGSSGCAVPASESVRRGSAGAATASRCRRAPTWTCTRDACRRELMADGLLTPCLIWQARADVSCRHALFNTAGARNASTRSARGGRAIWCGGVTRRGARLRRHEPPDAHSGGDGRGDEAAALRAESNLGPHPTAHSWQMWRWADDGAPPRRTPRAAATGAGR